MFSLIVVDSEYYTQILNRVNSKTINILIAQLTG